MKKLKIATILPYKENYSLEKASAASLCVAEFYKDSKFKYNNIIYGYTNSKNYLTNNYIILLYFLFFHLKKISLDHN